MVLNICLKNHTLRFLQFRFPEFSQEAMNAIHRSTQSELDMQLRQPNTQKQSAAHYSLLPSKPPKAYSFPDAEAKPSPYVDKGLSPEVFWVLHVKLEMLNW